MTLRNSYNQFPRSTLRTPGTMIPLLAHASQKKKKKGFHFLSLAATASETN